MEHQDCYLKWPAVHKLTGVSRVTTWRWEKKFLFPKRRQLGPGSVAWLRSEVVTWMATRVVAGGKP
jgi:predicted DNA-binding transcriptional regulator AlpA